jgi:proline dehydrogenase
MSMLNFVLAQILPVIPKVMIKPFSKPYVAGETEDDAMKVVQHLNENGFSVTLDILGEHVESELESGAVTNAYAHLYERISADHLDCNLSIKLTHLGLCIGENIAMKNLEFLIKRAEASGNFLRIDMENSPYTDNTLVIYKQLLQDYPRVGVVLQAYLKRTTNDIELLNSSSFNARICKGIYKESPEIAYQDHQEIRDHFSDAVKDILSGEGYAAIATHDLELIDTLEHWILENKIEQSRYEFQVLYGVPMSGRLERLKEAGHRVRIYVPFGPDWYDYSIRRLKENPQIISYVMKNFFRK